MQPLKRISDSQRQFLLDGVQQNLRSDGRGPFDYRRVTFELNCIPSSTSSCRLRAGDTELLLALKCDLAKPRLQPDAGHVQVTVECAPSVSVALADSSTAEDWGRRLSTLCASDSVIDRKALCLLPHVFAWQVHVDVLVLSSGGNLLDSLALALGAVLSETLLPKVEVIEALEEGEEVQLKVDDRPEAGLRFPTLGRSNPLGNGLLYWITWWLAARQAMLCVVVDGKTGDIIGLHKLGRGLFDVSALPSMLERCRGTAAVLVQQLPGGIEGAGGTSTEHGHHEKSRSWTMATPLIEVEEPDLSMELMGQLRVHFSALEADFFKEVRSGHDEQQVRFKYADAAAAEIVCMLQSFNPDISEEELSRDAHSIIHTESVVGHLHQPMLTALRECVPLDRRAWLANDVQRHLLRQRRRRPLLKVLGAFQRQSQDVFVFDGFALAVGPLGWWPGAPWALPVGCSPLSSPLEHPSHWVLQLVALVGSSRALPRAALLAWLGAAYWAAAMLSECSAQALGRPASLRAPTAGLPVGQDGQGVTAPAERIKVLPRSEGGTGESCRHPVLRLMAADWMALAIAREAVRSARTAPSRWASDAAARRLRAVLLPQDKAVLRRLLQGLEAKSESDALRFSSKQRKAFEALRGTERPGRVPRPRGDWDFIAPPQDEGFPKADGVVQANAQKDLCRKNQFKLGLIVQEEQCDEEPLMDPRSSMEPGRLPADGRLHPPDRHTHQRHVRSLSLCLQNVEQDPEDFATRVDGKRDEWNSIVPDGAHGVNQVQVKDLKDLGRKKKSKPHLIVQEEQCFLE
eukprot:g27722.t1